MMPRVLPLFGLKLQSLLLSLNGDREGGGGQRERERQEEEHKNIRFIRPLFSSSPFFLYLFVSLIVNNNLFSNIEKENKSVIIGTIFKKFKILQIKSHDRKEMKAWAKKLGTIVCQEI